jgi:hypothetical protein
VLSFCRWGVQSSWGGRNTEQRREQRQRIPSQRMLLDERLKPAALSIGGLIGF